MRFSFDENNFSKIGINVIIFNKKILSFWGSIYYQNNSLINYQLLPNKVYKFTFSSPLEFSLDNNRSFYQQEKPCNNILQHTYDINLPYRSLSAEIKRMRFLKKDPIQYPANVICRCNLEAYLQSSSGLCYDRRILR